MDCDKINSRHKGLEYDNNLVPDEGQPDLLCRNKESLGCPSLGVSEVVLTEETIRAVRKLGDVLRRIHDRLISEGYVLENGEFVKSNDTTTNPTE
ncbi:MAG TPA: hypothetical protein VK809_04355 [Bacteroidia bacterium]|jgi:hypothetical protein|nr:hypothetical protein [Bacteroidia bacterium]